MTLRKKRPSPGFFDEEHRLEALSAHGDPLERLTEIIDWEIFRQILNETLRKEPKGPGGRPAYDYVMMFKILILQSIYDLADGKTQFMILDRLSFQRFLGLRINDAVPDEKKIWEFRNKLAEAGIIIELFNTFKAVLTEKGLLLKTGSIIDASIIKAPKQHLRKAEKKALEKGETPTEWERKPAIERQRDTDATWTKKHGKTYFGYKNHVKVTRENKMIETFEVTPASTHDSMVTGILLDKNEDAGKEIYADKAYAGEPVRKKIRANRAKNRVLKKATKGEVLGAYAKKINKAYSRVRARVEHVFAAIEKSVGGLHLRCIGIDRAYVAIGLKNIAYNMQRMGFLTSSA